MTIMDFKKFKTQFQENFQKVLADADHLFVTGVEKDLIWDTYLNSFPPDEKQDFNCSACRHFLRPYANVVAIKDNKAVSMWNFECDEPYQTVVKKMNALVLTAPVVDAFTTKVSKLGIDFNHEKNEDGSIITWHHFHLVLPNKFVTRSSESEESIMSNVKSAKGVFRRGLEEITKEAVDTVLELIEQKSLYRGEESKGLVQSFQKLKKDYDKLPEYEKDNYCWANASKAGGALSKIKNSSIGTLLMDISEGKELDHAVNAFEKIMAPQNYKRPNPIVTKADIEKAQKKIEELGMSESLGRRFAVVDDITVNNVLFADRNVKKAMNVFEELAAENSVNPKKYNKVDEVTIENFVENILPKATSVELLFENPHLNNLMSLIAPKNATAPTMFKWKDNFSWSYNNDVADSIKEKVKTRGGKVDGVLRFSIMWAENTDDNSDLDAHCVEPNGNRIYFSRMVSASSGGNLDVDIQTPSSYQNKDIVENITWPTKSKMPNGVYQFMVHGYSMRGNNKGFTAEIEFNGQIFSYTYNKPVRNGEYVNVAEVTLKNGEFSITHSLENSIASKEMWGISTNQFQKVSMLMHSPNHWDEQNIGNKHYFFILEGCKNPNSPRGFYNEFLKEELLQQKRVFEALGSKMKVEESDVQLSGLGFSSTNKNSVICKVDGAFSRTIKINF